MLFFAWYPLFLCYLNIEPPSRLSLQEVSGRLLEMNSRAPHFSIQKTDGSVFTANFPGVFTFLRPLSVRQKYLTGMNYLDVRSCSNVVLKVEQLRYYPSAQYRIWGIGCDDDVYFSFDEIKIEWRRVRYKGIFVMAAIFSAAYLLFLFLIYTRERLDHEQHK